MLPSETVRKLAFGEKTWRRRPPTSCGLRAVASAHDGDLSVGAMHRDAAFYPTPKLHPRFMCRRQQVAACVLRAALHRYRALQQHVVDVRCSMGERQKGLVGAARGGLRACSSVQPLRWGARRALIRSCVLLQR